MAKREHGGPNHLCCEVSMETIPLPWSFLCSQEAGWLQPSLCCSQSQCCWFWIGDHTLFVRAMRSYHKNDGENKDQSANSADQHDWQQRKIIIITSVMSDNEAYSWSGVGCQQVKKARGLKAHFIVTLRHKSECLEPKWGSILPDGKTWVANADLNWHKEKNLVNGVLLANRFLEVILIFLHIQNSSSINKSTQKKSSLPVGREPTPNWRLSVPCGGHFAKGVYSVQCQMFGWVVVEHLGKRLWQACC